MKKEISLIMAVAMAISTFFTVSAAASDIVVPAKVLMSHDFTKDTETPAGWTVSTGAQAGNWGFDNGLYITQTDKTLTAASSEAYDAAGQPYTITVNHSLTNNEHLTYFAIQDNSAYCISIKGNSAQNRYVTLYKTENGTKTELAKSSEAISSDIWYNYTHETGAEIKIVVGLESIDVYVAGKQMISYANTYDNSIASGKIKFASGYQTYKLYGFDIVTEETVLSPVNTGASVDFGLPSKPIMSHDFTKDTALPEGWEEYKADDMTGYTFDGGLYITQTNRMLRITSLNEYDAKGKPYTITVNHSLIAGGYYTYFAIQENSKYYVKIYGNGASNRYVYLYKVINGEETLLGTSESPISSGLWKDANSNGATIKIVVGLESIDVYVEGTLMLSCANTYDSSISSGKIAFSNGYNVYRLFGFNVATNPTTVHVEDFILNRSFTKSDTKAELENDGWSVTMHSNADAVTANALGASAIGYDADIAGNYTVEVGACKSYNDSYIYLRYDAETKTGYAVRSRLSSSGYISIGKVVNGTYAEKEKFEMPGRYDAGNTQFFASVKDAGDDVEISFRVVFGTQDNTKTWTDVKTEDNDPIKTAGGFLFKGGDTAYSYVSYVKAYPTAIGSRAVSDAEVRYYIGNRLAENLDMEGTVYVNMPTAILGEGFTVISALYDNGMLKNVRVVDGAEAYDFAGAELFNAEGLSADAYIATYIWSDLDNIKPLTAPALLR